MVLSGSISNKKKHEADRIRVLLNEKKKRLEEDEDRKKRNEIAKQQREEQIKSEQRKKILGDADPKGKEERKKEREDFGPSNVI